MMHPWHVGQDVRTLETPALLLDLEALDRNIATVAGVCSAASIGWRPHVKSIRVPAIAHRMLAAGAIGVTCAKLSETEVMAFAGMPDILLANQMVTPGKMTRLAALARHSRVIGCVDSPANAHALNEAALAFGARLGLVIEVETGMARAGSPAGEKTVALARLIAHLPGLRFAGLMTWEGHASGITDRAEKAAAVTAALSLLTDTADLCRAAGLPAAIVSCGGTATYQMSTAHRGVTENQAGGGVFGDVRGRDRYGLDHALALTVLSTVVSRPTPERIICDAGKKAMSTESALPELCGVRGVRSLRFSAEHTTVEMAEAQAGYRPGSTVQFAVGYADTTMHLHDYVLAIRGGRVEAIWAIPGRTA